MANWLTLQQSIFVRIFAMRTTIDLPDPLFREVKTRAVQQGMKLKDLVADYIEAGLRGNGGPAPNVEPRQRSPIPIARGADGTVTPALTNAQLQAILDEEDLAVYHKR